ncbi:hypothetical protein [Sphingomonas rubra]|uniref:Uncharacterized protein n=1 Tax=Sphingomonas rubra TaxID=634430 RepID=A0A1I5UXL0_9SPHN|nr:hypothetical protein [Sphingomonas rubra]SFP99787.1 hypothetical protein SAMN04488241_1196 [Sphingomonas rubra]
MTDDLPTMPVIRDLLRHAAEARGGEHDEHARSWQAMAEEGIRLLADDELIRGYERTTGEPGSREAAALLAEIKRRGLDV